MSAKLLYTSSKDENQDLQKQIGCMNGIFQFFDRHHFLTGRRSNSQGHKRLLPGQNRNPATKPRALQRITERNPKKFVKQKQRVSTESSQTSLSSSSCSSSYSSLDCKTAQFEPSLFNQPRFPGNPTLPMNKPYASLQSSQQSLDLRDVVKEPIYREGRALSVKTYRKEEAVGTTLKYIDSPRPLSPPKSVKSRASGANDSVRSLAQLQEAPTNYKKQKQRIVLSSLKDAPRLSYDGRVSQDACKSRIKLKELPRLSLDSREGSIRGLASETKSNFLLKDLKRRNDDSSEKLNQKQEPESSERPSNLIVKLMGLEAFQQSTSTGENPLGFISSCQTDKSDPLSKSSRATDGNKKNQISTFPRKSHKDPMSSRSKNADSVMRPTSRSRFPTEQTPWRQPDGRQSSQQIAFKYREATTKASNSYPSVYGEIEKRLAELEFKKSGKDLRAPKQIIEAMQKTNKALDYKREQPSKFASQTSNYSSYHQSSNLASPRKAQNKDSVSTTIKGLHSPESSIFPTVKIRRTIDCASTIIPTERMSGLNKPGFSANGRMVNMQTAKDHFSPPSCSTDKKTNVRTSKSTSALKVPQHIIGENNTGSVTVSPRLQQRKISSQKQSPLTIPSSDTSKVIGQRTRQQVGPNSQGRKLRLISPSLQQCNDQLSETSSGVRDLTHQGDTFSLTSESNISLCSHTDTEVTSTNHSDKINANFFKQDGKNKNPPGSSKDRIMVKPAIAALEQPSPVFVLDATFNRDKSPSPVKKISKAFKDYEARDPEEGEWIPVDLAQLPPRTKPCFSADVDDKKSESIHHLVQNIHQENTTEEETITDYTAALHESMNSNHRYISEMLLSLGLLGDLDSGSTTIRLQASGHHINFNSFFALEQTKASAGLLNDKQSDERIFNLEPSEKIQRVLECDTVNEILVRKLLLGCPTPPQKWLSPNKIAARNPKGQQLLEEICSEVDRLKNNNLNRSLVEEYDSLSIISEDLTHRSMKWIDFHCEIPGLVLDIEWLIFEDLITENVNSQGVGLQGQSGGPFRKLFSR
ncbi:protein LONGIFOLIA 2-like [Juglans microcarpa x Juglans regia]|uniref:protein LONGIFOLIA 2-like n=1 Tax=Juglans microcarpa x Juglans regia TaxID=2249226 RepID=UPI001B7D975E|nr:protein LONGIFOLIA 2-like [Juglans microcarpa x Juglans regia]XP_041007594.1 protein LONGIFOLIA 2-like [Juglans microcarpa x Juglans regia]XP_041007595.1 protein LONGIFOLIA 2-like [Juglans microcarpa x Juglans regia]